MAPTNSSPPFPQKDFCGILSYAGIIHRFSLRNGKGRAGGSPRVARRDRQDCKDLRNVGGTSGAESEKNGERIGESYLVFHGRSYFRDRVVRHLRCLPHSGGSCHSWQTVLAGRMAAVENLCIIRAKQTLLYFFVYAKHLCRLM